MERGAIRVFVSGAGKSQISLRSGIRMSLAENYVGLPVEV